MFVFYFEEKRDKDFIAVNSMPEWYCFFSKQRKVVFRLLFLFVTVSSRSFFTLVSSYLMSFSFFTTWHNV